MYDVHVSPHASTKNAPNLGAKSPGRNSRRPRQSFPALMAGVNPGPVPVHKTLPSTSSERHAVSATTALRTRTTRTAGASTTRKSTAQRSLYGLPNRQDHVTRPLHQHIPREFQISNLVDNTGRRVDTNRESCVLSRVRCTTRDTGCLPIDSFLHLNTFDNEC